METPPAPAAPVGGSSGEPRLVGGQELVKLKFSDSDDPLGASAESKAKAVYQKLTESEQDALNTKLVDRLRAGGPNPWGNPWRMNEDIHDTLKEIEGIQNKERKAERLADLVREFRTLFGDEWWARISGNPWTIGEPDPFPLLPQQQQQRQ